jgi:predicted acyltransferase
MIEKVLLNNTARVESVDIYRGFVMFLMMAEIIALAKVAKALPDSAFWQFLAFHQDHVPWVGCSLHDLIQPSFSFLVGVALPYSIATRQAKGGSFGAMLWHAGQRALILIFLGIFLRSMHSSQTYFTFEDTLTQIGLGYFFLFLLGFANLRIIYSSLIFILLAYFLAFALYPLPDANFDYTRVGVLPNWEHNLSGFAAHWNKNTNLAMAFDQWFLNLFPREKPFLYNEGGYVTLSFIPTLGTMILGLLAGKTLKSETSPLSKIKTYLIGGFTLLILGFLLDLLGICPNVKRIWTPTWVLFSGGWCFLFLALFYWLVDIRQNQRWFYALKVLGANSIAAYFIAHSVDSFIGKSLLIHLGANYAQIFGLTYSSLVHGSLILFFEWLILHWMFKKKIFIKI